MTFYKHFPSKDYLIVAWLRQRDQEWYAWFKAAVQKRAARPGQRVLAAFDALAEWFVEEDFRGCAFINAVAEFGDRDPPAHQAAIGSSTM